MLLLTYDPSLKQSQASSISLTSPYGNNAMFREIRRGVAEITAFGALMALAIGDFTQAKKLMEISQEAMA